MTQNLNVQAKMSIEIQYVGDALDLGPGKKHELKLRSPQHY